MPLLIASATRWQRSVGSRKGFVASGAN
jgi:hypothetical protein